MNTTVMMGGEPVTYVEMIPDLIPPGRVLVHNTVRTRFPQHPPGSYGSRAWLADAGPRYVRCRCGWAPHLQHYRVNPAEVA
jgi:hypothetical protein